MKFLVTGSAGFIGMNVAQELLNDGHEVVGLDSFNDYYSPRLKRDRHAQLTHRASFTELEADLTDRDAMTRCFQTHRFDAVCHLAAQAGVRYSLKHPEAYIRANIEGFLNILEACRHTAPSPRLVYASSSSVYGGNTKLPFSEDDRVDNPVSLYAATKKSDELMAHAYSHLFGIQTIGLRFFTVYGPWGRPDMAMWLFTEAMLAGRSIKVFNHGEMSRDFTYIDDIVAGVKASLLAPDLGAYELFNLGNHRSEKLMHMIRVLADVLGVEPKMDLLPIQPGDVPDTFADVARARLKLGFEPKTPIEIGVRKFADWYREYHAL